MKKKLLLIYIGNEQGSWGNIAFPKPSHFYVMPGILYCGAVLKADSSINELLDIKTLYFNATVESREEMISLVRAENPSLVGFSTFCWNRDIVLYCCKYLKQVTPNLPVMLGGPEMSMEKREETDLFFLQNPCIDMVVFGEAEKKIASLAMSLISNDQEKLSGVTGFACSSNYFNGYCDFSQMSTTNLEEIPSPYPSDIRVKRSDQCGLAMVYETTRGCPYRCIYCRFGHKRKKIHSLQLIRVEQELSWLIDQEFDCIHFADPVFDLEPRRAVHILQFLRDKNKRSSLFFYCSFHNLDHELARLFEETQCQIGVGVQSTNHEVLKTIQRTIPANLLQEKKKILNNYKINFYTDLIFGLPNDNLESFYKSLNEMIALRPSFLMLFPLTLIKGTPLEQQASLFGMKGVGDKDLKNHNLLCDIEYHNISLYETFSSNDLQVFDDIAITCFYLYTRFRYSLMHLEKRTQNPAQIYHRIGALIKEYLISIERTPSNTENIEGFQDEIQRIFHFVLDNIGAGKTEKEAFDELFRLDIYRVILLSAPQRIKIFTQGYSVRIGKENDENIKEEKNVILAAHGKIIRIRYNPESLEMLHVLRENIVASAESVYLFSAFEKWDTSLLNVNQLLEVLLNNVSANRPVSLSKLVSTLKQRLKGSMDEMELIQELDRYEKMGIIRYI